MWVLGVKSLGIYETEKGRDGKIRCWPGLPAPPLSLALARFLPIPAAPWQAFSSPLQSGSFFFFKSAFVCAELLPPAVERPFAAQPFLADSPVEASSLLLLLESDVFQLQRTRDEADLAAFFHQAADPPVVVELLRILSHMNRSHLHAECG